MTISLPKKMQKQVALAVREGGFSSTSEFFRMLIRNWQDEQLLKEIEVARQEIRDGKGVRLKSIRDLMD